MPMDFVNMHRKFGYNSRLITYYKNTLNFPEDISLHLPTHTGKLAKKWRDSKIQETPSYSVNKEELKYYSAKNPLESVYFSLRDFKNAKKINKAIKEFNLNEYDIYHFDGGMDLYRDCRFAISLKEKKKKIVCCYFGSDLRTRGIFKKMDEISDLNLTVEFDHLKLHKNINYIFFPFDESEFTPKPRNNSKLKIVHSPTNRHFKGTDKIIPIIDEIKNERQIEFLLLENLPRDKVLEIKSTCDIAIDQVGGESGGSGYGKNSLETLAMGIPTVTEFSDDYLKFLGDNPFINSDISNLKNNLLKLIDNDTLRNDISKKGIEWIKNTHSFEAVNKSLLNLYSKYNIC